MGERAIYDTPQSLEKEEGKNLNMRETDRDREKGKKGTEAGMNLNRFCQ